jgi:hypothetical protein
VQLIENPIATRTLVIDASPEDIVTVVLGPPYLIDGTEYRCHYQILGIGKGAVRYGAGVDEFQSLWLAFRMLTVDIERLNSSQETRLRWPEHPDAQNCGFYE